jgi:hypothetical protein
MSATVAEHELDCPQELRSRTDLGEQLNRINLVTVVEIIEGALLFGQLQNGWLRWQLASTTGAPEICEE